MTDRLQCRLATVEDYQAVVDIITPYFGRDYMSFSYHHMAADPNFVGVLGELNGETVAFAGAYIVNDGTTMTTKGSRVKEELQGRGLYRQLWEYLRETILSRSPSLQFEEFAVNSISRLLTLPPSEQKYTQLFRRPLKSYNVVSPEHQSDEVRTPMNGITVEEISVDRLRDLLFTDDTTCARLFPQRLVIAWQVYMPTTDNIDVIRSQDMNIVATLSSDRLIFLTVGTWFECKEYLAYSIDCYGGSTLDASHHINIHIENACRLYRGKVTITIFADDKCMENMDQACRKAGLEYFELFTSHMAVFSRTF